MKINKILTNYQSFKKNTESTNHHDDIQREDVSVSDCTFEILNANAISAKAGINLHKPTLEESKKELEQRLENINILKKTSSSKRFGKDGIRSILEYANSEKNIAIINKELDELMKGKNIWTSDIIDKLEESGDKPINDQSSGRKSRINGVSTDKPESHGINNNVFYTTEGTKVTGPIKELLTKKSTNPEVIALEQKMKEMGYNANFSDNLKTGKIITNAYEKMHKKGFKMPKEIALMIPISKNIMGYRPFSMNANRLETPIIFNSELYKKNEAKPLFFDIGIKYNSTDSPESVVYHEIGHFLHEDSGKDVEHPSTIWKNLANDGFDLELAEEVGYYAMTGDKFHMGREYVAEVFAGLMEDNQYSERVMDLYSALGGPKVK